MKWKLIKGQLIHPSQEYFQRRISISSFLDYLRFNTSNIEDVHFFDFFNLNYHTRFMSKVYWCIAQFDDNLSHYLRTSKEVINFKGSIIQGKLAVKIAPSKRFPFLFTASCYHMWDRDESFAKSANNSTKMKGREVDKIKECRKRNHRRRSSRD
jgi:hypothetical protein